jgi:hypothetical protein
MRCAPDFFEKPGNRVSANSVRILLSPVW